MRKMIVVGLLAGLITAAHGSEQLSVAQLERKLDASLKKVAGGGPDHAQVDLFDDLSADTTMLRDAAEDSELARQLYRVELTERLTPHTLERIVQEEQPGLETKRALAFLRDRSAFLDPPQSEWVALASPNAEGQKHALELARGYVSQTLLRLPNFFATRTTTSLVSVPPPRGELVLPGAEEPHLEGTSVLDITFRDGKEYVTPTDKSGAGNVAADSGLASQGEFGSEAATVLVDLGDQTNGTAAFHHWEMTPAGLAAVYRYAVGSAGSHYEVQYACKARTAFRAFPSYHGSIAIRQATGTVLRITVAADWKPGDPISHVTSAIEYGPAAIGGRDWICPLQSIAFMAVEQDACKRLRGPKRLSEPAMMLNRTTFSNYHRLGSTITIIPTEKEQPQGPGD
jgi:hypothetical protein